MRTAAAKLQWLAIIAAHPGSTPSALATAVALSSFHNCKTQQCNPSISAIARASGQTDRSVRRGLTTLKKIGLIETTETRGGQRNRTNSFKLLETPETTAVTPGKNVTPSKNVTPDTDGIIPLTVLSPRTEKIKQEHNPPIIPPRKKSGIVTENIPESISLEAAEEFIAHRVKKKSPLTQNAFDRAMMAALKASQALGISADEAIHETIDAGWQGIRADWLANRMRSNETDKRIFKSTSEVFADNLAAAAGDDETGREGIRGARGDIREPLVGTVERPKDHEAGPREVGTRVIPIWG